jgi:hypothetical protein
MRNIKMVLPIAVLFAVGCKKSQDVTPAQDLNTTIGSAKSTEQLATAKRDINKVASSKVMLVSYSRVGVINNAGEKQALLDRMFAPDAKTVVGALNFPNQITVLADKDVVRNAEQQQMQRSIIASLSDAIQTGDEVLELKWLVNGKETVTTTAISNTEKGIVWDNFLYNLPTFTVTEGQGATEAYNPAARTQVFNAAPVRVSTFVLGGEAAFAQYDLQAVWDYNVRQYVSKIHSISRGNWFGFSAAGRGSDYWPNSTKRTVEGKYGLATATANVSITISGGSGTSNFSVSFSGGSGNQRTGTKLINTPVGQ